MADDLKGNGSECFALRLYHQLTSLHNENVFFSPVSVAATLSMTLLGAKANTRLELMDGLGVQDESKVHQKNFDIIRRKGAEGTTLSCACQLFPDLHFTMNDNFLGECRKFYETSVAALNFQQNANDSRQVINDWAKSATAGKIEELLPADSVDPATRLVLANAVYFKGDWMNKFDAGETKKVKFYINESDAVDVDMMVQKKKYNLFYDLDAELKVVEIPYAGNEVSMMLFVPTKRCGLADVEQKLTSAYLESIVPKFCKEQVLLSMPKMKLEYSADLQQHLVELGIRDLFDPNNSDLTGISCQPGLYVSKLAHKAIIEVNEEGTEAAAATAAVATFAMILPPIEVTCDHPFMLLIKDKPSDSILFAGRFMSP